VTHDTSSVKLGHYPGARLLSVTEMTETLKRHKLLQRWSAVLFASAMVILIASASYGPRSLGYLIRALTIGSIFSVLTVAYWKWESKYPNRLIWSVLIVVLIIGGFYWSRDQTLGVTQAEGFFWGLAGQFISTVSAVFFGVVSALTYKRKKTVSS